MNRTTRCAARCTTGYSIRCFAYVSIASIAALSSAGGQASTADVRDEAGYASSIAHVADSAIHRLDFFPTRMQMRVQMLFMTPRDSAGAFFVEIGRRSVGAAILVDEISSRFEGTRVPDDLGKLHAEMVASLRAARTALDHLASSANACQFDVASVQRCQSPFTSASSALAQAYKRYLDARAKIRDQILDTQTVLPDFKPAPGGRDQRQTRQAIQSAQLVVARPRPGRE